MARLPRATEAPVRTDAEAKAAREGRLARLSEAAADMEYTPGAEWTWREGVAAVQGIAAAMGIDATTPANVKALRDRLCPHLAETKLSAMTREDYDALVAAIRTGEDHTDAEPPVVEIQTARIDGRITELRVSVSRKLTHNYQSTEYHAGVTVALEIGSDVPQVAADTYDMLRAIIRNEFARTKGNGNGSSPESV